MIPDKNRALLAAFRQLFRIKRAKSGFFVFGGRALIDAE
jgi:hypothetical protein